MYIYEFTVVCVVTDVLYMCLIHVKGIKIKKNKKNIYKKKKIRHEENNKIRTPPPPPPLLKRKRKLNKK